MILLDTAAIVWWLADDPRLSAEARGAIAGSESVYVSAASIWEMAIKRARHRLIAPDDYLDRLLDGGLAPLSIEWEHARVASELPRHHGDPFDRLLIAQAIVEHLTIVTPDAKFEAYAVPVIAA